MKGNLGTLLFSSRRDPCQDQENALPSHRFSRCCFLPPTLLARIIDSPIVVLQTPIVVINCTDPSLLGGAELVSSNHSGRRVTSFVQIALCQWLALQSNHSPVTRAPVTVRSPTRRSATALRYEPIALQHTILDSSRPSTPRTQDAFPLVPTSHQASPDQTSSQAHVSCTLHSESLVASASHRILREPQRVFQRFALNLLQPLSSSVRFQRPGFSDAVANATTIDDATDSAAHSSLQPQAYPRALPNPKTAVA